MTETGLCLDLEALPALRLGSEDARKRYLDHAVTSTNRIGRRCRTASTHLSLSRRTKNEALWVPK
jgi:hypothetical protein